MVLVNTYTAKCGARLGSSTGHVGLSSSLLFETSAATRNPTGSSDRPLRPATPETLLGAVSWSDSQATLNDYYCKSQK
jgi:hypothetical protein